MQEGDQAPNFSLYDHTGARRALYSFLEDGPVVLFFYPIASSPICSVEACHFRDLGADFAMVGAQRVGISPDSVEKQARFAQQRAFDFPLLSDADGTVAANFGVRRGAIAAVAERMSARGGRHSHKRKQRRGLLARLAPVKRVTFVIDGDGTVVKKISSELRANIHANQALWYLQTQHRPLAR
jgi:thioredoxin-dependent peroxiredoxin